MVKLSHLTALATWWRGCYTPHTGPEAFAVMRQSEVRTAKHCHAPSKQQSIATLPANSRATRPSQMQPDAQTNQRTDWARAPHRTNRGGKGSQKRQEGSRLPNKQDTSKGTQPHRGTQHKRRNNSKHTNGFQSIGVQVHQL